MHNKQAQEMARAAPGPPLRLDVGRTMEQLLLAIFYPIGWALVKVFTLGKAKPEKWNWRIFFEFESDSNKCAQKYTISCRATAAVELVAFAIFAFAHSIMLII